MLSVEDYEVIRRKVVIEGKSQRATAQELFHSRKTISKALKYGSPPGYRRTKPPPKPVIDSVSHIIDAWLDEDKNRPRKQRHTAQRIFERLRDEHSFKGSSSSVRRFVAYRKQTGGELFFPLQFEAGEEFQVDFGEAWCFMAGVMTKVRLFCMRLCYSTACFVWAYPTEKAESFFDGHVRAFEFFGGVGLRGAYDNLSIAVVSVGKGRERRLTRRFICSPSFRSTTLRRPYAFALNAGPSGSGRTSPREGRKPGPQPKGEGRGGAGGAPVKRLLRSLSLGWLTF